MNFSYVILAITAFALYLQDEILARFNRTHFTFESAASVIRESLSVGFYYLTFILLSCVTLVLLVTMINKIKKAPANNRVQSVVNTHALLVVFSLVIILIVYPSVVGIKRLFSDSDNDLFTFWLFISFVIGTSFSVFLFAVLKSEWLKVIAKYEDYDDSELFVAAQLGHVQDVTPVAPVHQPVARKQHSARQYQQQNNRSQRNQNNSNYKPKTKNTSVQRPQPPVVSQNVVNNGSRTKSVPQNVQPQFEVDQFSQPDLNNPPDFIQQDFDYQFGSINLDDPRNQPPVYSDDNFDYEHDFAMHQQQDYADRSGKPTTNK